MLTASKTALNPTQCSNRLLRTYSVLTPATSLQHKRSAGKEPGTVETSVHAGRLRAEARHVCIARRAAVLAHASVSQMHAVVKGPRGSVRWSPQAFYDWFMAAPPTCGLRRSPPGSPPTQVPGVDDRHSLARGVSRGCSQAANFQERLS